MLVGEVPEPGAEVLGCEDYEANEEHQGDVDCEIDLGVFKYSGREQREAWKEDIEEGGLRIET